MAATAAAASPSEPQALALVEAYNARNFGDPGWRRVRLDLKSGEAITRSFTVSNLWRREGGQVRTLFVLEAPAGLRGTDYLLVEDPSRPQGMEVYLHLPAGRRRVLTVQPSNFDEGLLGSDFGYRDLRLRIPTVGYRFRSAGRTAVLGRPVSIVEAEPESADARQVSWARSLYYLSAEPPLLLGADHFAERQDRVPSKRMRVGGVRQEGGAWTETRIVMSAADGRSSVLSLEAFRPAVPAAGPELFEPGALPAAGEHLAAVVPAPPAGGGE